MDRIKRFYRRLRQYVPGVSVFFFFFALVALLFHIVSALSAGFADFTNRTIAGAFRAALGYSTALLPFSLAEWVILLVPLWLGGLIFLAVRLSRDGKKAKRFLAFLLSLLLLFYGLFVFTLGTGYLGTPLHEKMGLEKKPVSAEELYDTALWLIKEAEEKEAKFEVGEDGASRMPFSYAQMNQKLIDAYASLAEKYAFIGTFSVGSKPIVLSRPMTYTHITGVYTFFTGEANVNTTYPDFSTLFTAAHEMAHQRGIARENEANFVAFLACIGAKEDYLAYSGYLNVLQYVLNALYSADKELYQNLSLSPRIVGEMHAYNKVYEQFDGAAIGNVADKVNDAYLGAMGTEGVASYGLVVDLAVAYRMALAEKAP